MQLPSSPCLHTNDHDGDALPASPAWYSFVVRLPAISISIENGISLKNDSFCRYTATSSFCSCVLLYVLAHILLPSLLDFADRDQFQLQVEVLVLLQLLVLLPARDPLRKLVRLLLHHLHLALVLDLSRTTHSPPYLHEVVEEPLLVLRVLPVLLVVPEHPPQLLQLPLFLLAHSARQLPSHRPRGHLALR